MIAKYDTIGIDYNATRKADPYLFQQLLSHLNPQKEGIYLDIGCGTGNYTDEFQKMGYSFIGIDPSKEMLKQARVRNQDIVWKMGTAEKTGLDENSVDGVVAFLTLHHWTNIENSFLELARILKPNGQIVIFTSTPEQMEGYWLAQYFPKMLIASKVKMPLLQNIEKAMKKAGIQLEKTTPYFVGRDLKDLFLYAGKHNPELYFDKKVRHGISSFNSLANKEEVANGLLALKKDISSGKIHEIIKSYENTLGDYLYVTGRKK
ncbi:class I SAM-dependent methyltransferase [uncultured Muriicola sp.]|uniref:class I SAM-dependent methyltransferase n=1 Tax=uncultured Muriicola sp. TaxID=1583102 RepID=UPI002616D17C|nr:class I SAM-dependent methyltransferase [uncultured Muriicola sp.]